MRNVHLCIVFICLGAFMRLPPTSCYSVLINMDETCSSIIIFSLRTVIKQICTLFLIKSSSKFIFIFSEEEVGQVLHWMGNVEEGVGVAGKMRQKVIRWERKCRQRWSVRGRGGES